MKLYLLLIFTITTGMIAQVDKQSALFLEIEKMDQMVFDEGFNNCNMEALDLATAADLEFYHDIGGVQDKAGFIEASRVNLCSDSTRHFTRQAVANSIEVFPLHRDKKLYGALQTGEHLFYLQESDQPIKITGYARFNSLWLLVEGEWKLKRVISYDHQAR